MNGIYNNYRKSSASPYPKKVNKIRLKLSNYNDKKKEILNTSFQSNKSIKREKVENQNHANHSIKSLYHFH